MKELFQFYLTAEQIKNIDHEDREAIRDFHQGAPGSIFCQIGRSKNDHNRYLVRGSYLPNEYAKRIKAIIDEYMSSTDES